MRSVVHVKHSNPTGSYKMLTIPKSMKGKLNIGLHSTKNLSKMEPVILVHGGAGDVPDSRVPAKIAGVKKAAAAGYKLLTNGGSVLDAVEAAVNIMEDDPAFNAGFGSALNIDGGVEMDASIMLGSNLSAGAVTVVRDIAHPISLARLVMEKTPHILLAGEGAIKFAKHQGIAFVEPGSLVSPDALSALNKFKEQNQKFTSEFGADINPGDVGTVGAVAIDSKGQLAAATSTGGLTGKMVGRSSDSSIIGSGTYADDDVGAVSTTGEGEPIAKFCLAHSIIKEMEYGKTANNAVKISLEKSKQRLNNVAGTIALSKAGEIGIAFTSKRMSWAYQKGNKIHFGIEHDQQLTEEILDVV